MRLLNEGIMTTYFRGLTMPSNSRLPSSIYDGQMPTDRKSRLMALVVFVLLLCAIGIWSNQYLHNLIWPISNESTQLFIGILILIYAVCMILPFMPAIELGVVLLAMLDIQGVILLYCITVMALSISYTIGRLIPVQVLKRLFRYLHFHKASDLFCAIAECDEKEQINRFLEHAPKRFIPFLLRHRYWVFGVAVNTPGNMILGGAGGIAMMSGVSRLFSFKNFVFTVLVAVSPLPVFVISMKLLMG